MIMFMSTSSTYLVVFGFLFLDSFLNTFGFGDFVACGFCKRPQFPPFLDDLRKEFLHRGLARLGVDEGG